MTRLSIFISSVALILAAVAGQNTLLSRTDARAEKGSPVGESAAVLSYTVLRHGCGDSDLYVMRYAPDGQPAGEAIASWCG